MSIADKIHVMWCMAILIPLGMIALSIQIQQMFGKFNGIFPSLILLVSTSPIAIFTLRSLDKNISASMRDSVICAGLAFGVLLAVAIATIVLYEPKTTTKATQDRQNSWDFVVSSHHITIDADGTRAEHVVRRFPGTGTAKQGMTQIPTTDTRYWAHSFTRGRWELYLDASEYAQLV